MAKGDRQNPYALTQLYCELMWAPYWKDASEQQLDILGRARGMSIALDEIERMGTHVVKDGDDPQVSGDWTVRSHEAERAFSVVNGLSR